MEPSEEERKQLKHYGIARKSGRYPWGSGGDPYQNAKAFKAYLAEMKAPPHNMTPTQIAKTIEAFANAGVTDRKDMIKFSTNDLRGNIAQSTEIIRSENIATAQKLREQHGHQMGASAIARQMGVTESTVRGWLAASEKAKEGSIRSIANTLIDQVKLKEYLDVGRGEHLYLGVSFTKFNTALAMLKDEGFMVHRLRTQQLGTDKPTELKVLTTGDKTWNDARLAVQRGDLRIITAQSDDGGLTFRTPKTLPVSVKSKSIEVRYGEDGGGKMDGIIELRRGVDELSLGGKRYGQVRIAVDGTHFLKGMAMYADDLPPGVNMRFNTPKSKNDPAVLADGKLGVMKPLKLNKETGEVDPSNPFGATVRPRVYLDKNGKEKTSPLNMVNEEGRWDEWANNLSSQMLSKQPLSLASKQLGLARKEREEDLNEILKLTNPVVKQKLLDEFAETADAAAVHLKAAAMPRQSTKVLLPMNSMRPHEIFAPDYDNGEKVVLVRHPHGGPFEIPELTVNNLNRRAQRIMGGARDAVGIHHTVAEQLSGADFDGDTVLVIPNPKGAVKTRPPLKELAGFDAKAEYRIPDDDTTTTRLTKKNTQTEMGKISNLITDMTIRGANDSEIARAVKHSMVVIDAEKHGLNYKKSAIDHNISQLKRDYQGAANAGASTIISRASAEARVPERKYLSGRSGIDPNTGERVYENTNGTYTRPVPEKVSKTGKVTPAHTVVVDKITKGTKMEFAKDAFELTSGPKGSPGQPIEGVYADHANSMKALANRARKEWLAITPPRASPRIKELYRKEVESLNTKLKLAERNAPLERRAQVLGNAMAKAKIDADPTLDKDAIKKIKYQALEDGRLITGADKLRIGTKENPLTDREWEAVQAGALSPTHLRTILNNADMKRVRELATPRYSGSLTPGQLARAKSMQASGRSATEIATALDLPRSTVVNNLELG